MLKFEGSDKKEPMNERSRSLRNYFTSLVVRAMMKILRFEEKRKLNVSKEKSNRKLMKTHKTCKKFQRKTKRKKRKNADLNTICICKMTPNQMVAAHNGITLVL